VMPLVGISATRRRVSVGSVGLDYGCDAYFAALDTDKLVWDVVGLFTFVSDGFGIYLDGFVS